MGKVCIECEFGCFCYFMYVDDFVMGYFWGVVRFQDIILFSGIMNVKVFCSYKGFF